MSTPEFEYAIVRGSKFAAFDCEALRGCSPSTDFLFNALGFVAIPVEEGALGWGTLPDPEHAFKDNNSLPHLGEYVIPFKEAIKYVTIDGDVGRGRSVELFSRSAKMGLVKLLRENKTDLPAAGSPPAAWITIVLE